MEHPKHRGHRTEYFFSGLWPEQGLVSIQLDHGWLRHHQHNPVDAGGVDEPAKIHVQPVREIQKQGMVKLEPMVL